MNYPQQLEGKRQVSTRLEMVGYFLDYQPSSSGVGKLAGRIIRGVQYPSEYFGGPYGREQFSTVDTDQDFSR